MVRASGTGDGGLPPFLLKTYEMVDDTSTDDIVSWSYSKTSFVVWNPPEFSRLLLPTYFKHNNFSSFIRQLNTYRFRKIDPDRWEFANEDFVKGQKNRLKNIYRRKPIHSHSHPPGSLLDAERAALDEKIDRLSRERAGLQSNILSIKHQKSALRLQFDDLSKRIDGMEKRQEDVLNFFDKALRKPTVVEHLLQKIQSMDLSVHNKKSRLTEAGQSLPVSENDLSKLLQTGNQEMRKFSDPKLHGNAKESDNKESSSQNPIREVVSLSSSKELQHNSQDQAPVRVNDLFWEQFLTERPGYTDKNEAYSNNKAKNVTKEWMEVMSVLMI